MYTRLFEQLTIRISEQQLKDQPEPGIKRIEHSLRLLTPLAFMLLLARTQLKEFATRADSSALHKFCLLFTRLPQRSDAESVGLENASGFVKNWIEAFLQQTNNSYK